MVGIRRFLTYFDSRVIDHEKILGNEWFSSFPSWVLIEGAPFGPDNMSLRKPLHWPALDYCLIHFRREIHV